MYPITRRYRVYHLDLHTATLSGKWYVEWILASIKLLSQNAGAFVFSDVNFTKVYLSDSKQQMPANMSSNDFCKYVGIPENLKSDKAPEFYGRHSEFLKSAKLKGIYFSYAAP